MNELTQSILKRLSMLEKKVEQLEGEESLDKDSQDVPQHTFSDRDNVDLYSMIKVDITNKRYQPEDYEYDIYESIITWDCTYHPDGILKTIRAVKGELEFMDLFGEPQFSILLTIDDVIEPKRTFKNEGIGFEYNQFENKHQWMLVTELENMQTRFRPLNVLYQDGTREDFTNY